MTLKLKLAAIFTLIILLAGAGMLFGVMEMGSLKNTFDDVLRRNVRQVQLIDAIVAQSLRIARDERALILAPDTAAMDQIAADMDARLAEIDAEITELTELSSPEGRAILDRFRSEWNRYLAANAAVRQAARLRSSAAGRAILRGSGQEAFETAHASLDALRATGMSAATARDTSGAGSGVSAVLVGEIDRIEQMMERLRASTYRSLAAMENPEDARRGVARTEEMLANLDTMIAETATRMPAAYRAEFAEAQRQITAWQGILRDVADKIVENGDYQARAISAGTATTARREADAQLRPADRVHPGTDERCGDAGARDIRLQQSDTARPSGRDHGVFDRRRGLDHPHRHPWSGDGAGHGARGRRR